MVTPSYTPIRARVVTKFSSECPSPPVTHSKPWMPSVRDLATMNPNDSLWPSSDDCGRGITSGTFYGNLRRYLKAAGLPPAGVHIFRHSAAKLRREAGESALTEILISSPSRNAKSSKCSIFPFENLARISLAIFAFMEGESRVARVEVGL